MRAPGFRVGQCRFPGANFECSARRSRVIEQGNDPWDRVRAQFNLARNEIDLSSAIHNILSVNVRRSSIIIERAAESSRLPLAGRYAKLASTETC